jgi:hypothetical protein
MAYISQFKYYTNNGVAPTDANFGSYQYVSLFDIVNNFMLMYNGNHSLVNNEERFKVLFHAKRAIQELNYDAFREVKTLQLTVSDDLRFILPSNYVNWVRISMYKDGYIRPLTENIQVMSTIQYEQNINGTIVFDINDNVVYIDPSRLNEDRFKVLFHAKRAIQELNYDAFREVKTLQLTVSDDLRFILPSNYVNWVRISMYKDGYIRPLTENIQVMSTIQYEQNINGTIVFDINDNVVYIDPSRLNEDRLDGVQKSIYLNSSNPQNGNLGWNIDGAWYFSYTIGARYGLNTETANFNPTFRVDNKAGVINFSSDMREESCILEYISDGMEGGDDTSVSVNKLFEKYIYAYINYEILDKKLGVQEYIVTRARKDKRAAYLNAKIRISKIHPGKLLMNLRGIDKIIK